MKSTAGSSVPEGVRVGNWAALTIGSLLFVPSLVYVGTGRSSLTPGVASVVLVLSVVYVGRITQARLPNAWLITLSLLCAFIPVPLFARSEGSVFRVGASIALGALVIAFVAILNSAVRNVSSEQLADGLWWVFCSLNAFGWAGILISTRGEYGGGGRPIFPFSEPSHFALAAAPIYLAMIVVLPARWRKYVLINTGLQAILFPSFITLAILLLLLLVSARLVTLVVVAMAAAGIAGIGGVPANGALGYFAHRLLFSTTSTSVSSLVFVQGWVDAYRGIVETNGLGWGFQTIGTQTPNVFAQRIYEVVHVYLNSTDGGAGLAAKMMAEMGVVGLLVSAFLLRRIGRSVLWLRGALMRKEDGAWTVNMAEKKLAIAHAFVGAFAVELLLRNEGYFSAGVIMLLIAMLQVREMQTEDVPHSRPRRRVAHRPS